MILKRVLARQQRVGRETPDPNHRDDRLSVSGSVSPLPGSDPSSRQALHHRSPLLRSCVDGNGNGNNGDDDKNKNKNNNRHDDDDDDDDNDHAGKRPRRLPIFRSLLFPHRFRFRFRVTRMLVGAAIFLALSLILPKWIFFAGRKLLMSRPAVLYGTPTDWNDVAGCLSRNHRRQVREHLKASRGSSSSSSSSNSTLTHIPLNPDVRWNWSRYSSPFTEDGTDSESGKNNNNDNDNDNNDIAGRRKTSIPRRRLLIAQYSGKGSYERLLREVEPINRAYARKWGHDYTTLIGTALKFPGLLYGDENDKDDDPQGIDGGASGRNGASRKGRIGDRYRRCRYFHGPDGTDSTTSTSTSTQSHYDYEAQSTFNKIPLLFKAIEESRKYDQVLILDADTMIVDFDYDITTLLLASSSSPSSPNPTDRGESTNAGFGGKESGSNDNGNEIGNDSGSGNGNAGGITNHDRDREEDASYFLTAYRVWKFESTSTWDVNAGITLWNLRHPSTLAVAEDWLRSSLSDPKQVLLKNDDQYYLQRSLQRAKRRRRNRVPTAGGKSGDNGSRTATGVSRFGESTRRVVRDWFREHTILPALLDWWHSRRTLPETSRSPVSGRHGRGHRYRCDDDRPHPRDGVGILAIRDEFEYYDATLVKHFKRDTASWSRTGLDQRVARIREAKTDICRKWPGDCLS